MATTTANLGLRKPDDQAPNDDLVDVTLDIANNMQIIDDVIGDADSDPDDIHTRLNDLEAATTNLTYPVSRTDTDKIATTTSSRHTSVGFSFVAPPSGSGEITISADLESSDTNGACSVWVEIRTGSTVGSGTLVYDGNSIESNAQVFIDASAEIIRMRAGNMDTVTGLTPGNTYNASAWVVTTSGTATVRAIKITWKPLP